MYTSIQSKFKAEKSGLLTADGCQLGTTIMEGHRMKSKCHKEFPPNVDSSLRTPGAIQSNGYAK